jgi:hypothetical protein
MGWRADDGGQTTLGFIVPLDDLNGYSMQFNPYTIIGRRDRDAIIPLGSMHNPYTGHTKWKRLVKM